MAIARNTLYIITQENCVNCPAAKAVVQEAINDSNIAMKTLDLQDLDPDFEFRLLEHQVFISSTPAIILETPDALKMLYCGSVPSIEDIREKLEAVTLD